MADDVNKKGGPVNGKGKVPKAIDEISNQYDRATSYEASLNDDKLQKLVDKAAEYEERLNGSTPGTPQYNNLAEQHAYAEDEAYKYSLTVDHGLTAKSNKVLARGLDVYSKSGNINRRTTTMSGQQTVRHAAKVNGGVFRPTNMIENDIQSDIEMASSLGTSLADEARGLQAGQSSDSIRERAGGLSDIEARIARNKALLKVQGREGLSTEKLTNRGEDLDRDVGEFLKRKHIENKITSGGVGTYDDEMKSLNDKRNNRSSAQADYEKAIETGASGVEDFAEKLHKANEALDEQTRVVKGMKDNSGGGGFDSSGGWKSFQAKAPLWQMGFQSASGAIDAAQDIEINHDIAQMSNRSKYANMGNAVYDRTRAGVTGHDVDSLFDVAGDQFVKDYSDRNKEITNKLMGTKIITDNAADGISRVAKYTAIGSGTAVATTLAAEALIAWGSGGTAIPALMSTSPATLATAATFGGKIGAGLALFDTGVNVAVDIHNQAMGNVGAAKGIESYGVAKELTAAERHVATTNMQALYNQGLGSYSAIQGMGSGVSGAIQKSLMDDKSLGDLATAGVSPNQAISLTAMMSSQAGSLDGAGGVDGAMRILGGAGRAAQRGQMSQEEYVSTAARMVAAGGKDSELEDIISAGMTKGMDNSKNIGQMVDATMSLSSGLASKGIGGSGAISDLLGASTGYLVSQGVNKNLATGSAAQGISDYNSAITDSGFNLGNIMQRSGLRSIDGLKNASTFQLNEISKLSMQDMAVLQAGGKEGNLLAKDLGMDNYRDKEGNVNTKMLKSISREALVKGLTNIGGLGEKQFSSVMNKFDSGEAFDSKEQALTRSIGGEKTIRAAGGKDINKKASYMEKFFDPFNLGAIPQQTAAKYDADTIAAGKKSAQETLKAASGDEFNAIAGLAKEVAAAVDPAKWGDKVLDAAKQFEVPAGKFLAATEQLDGTVKRLIDYQTKALEKMGENRGGGIPTEEKNMWNPLNW